MLKIAPLRKKRYPARGARKKQFPINTPSNLTSLVEGTVDPGRPVRHAVHMDAITYTAARENLASTMDRVCNDHTPIIITRNRDQSVVMLSLKDFEALEETAYLLRSPVNAKRLLDSIHSLENGQGIVRSIDLNS
jgi:antitoxin YefM